MTVKYGFYDSLNGDRLYNANDINTFFEGVFSDGVFEFVGNALEVTNDPGTMNIIVKDGRAYFNNLWIRNTSSLTLSLQPSSLIYDRIDIVVLEFDSNITVRENSIKIITGAPLSSPVPPVLVNNSNLNQYALAHIYVPATVSEILPENITNKIGTVFTPYAKSLISEPLAIDPLAILNMGDSRWRKLGPVHGDSFPEAPQDGNFYGRKDGAWVNLSTMGGGDMVMLADVTLGSNAANIDFSSIPSIYKHLKLIFSLRSDRAGAAADKVKVLINNDTTAGHYESTLFYWYHTNQYGTEIASAAAYSWVGYITASTALANSFGGGFLEFPDYANTSKLKLYQGRSGMMQSTTIHPEIYDSMVVWQQTAAIDRITLLPNVGSNFVTGSKVTLYGLK